LPNSEFQGCFKQALSQQPDGTFSDVSDTAKIANPKGKGLGVVALDYDNDGRMDIFQANDATANFSFTTMVTAVFRK